MVEKFRKKHQKIQNFFLNIDIFKKNKKTLVFIQKNEFKCLKIIYIFKPIFIILKTNNMVICNNYMCV